VLGHVDFAAHLAHLRHLAALQFLRHVLERADIGGDVLALGAVAAGGGGDELALLIAQRHRQPVDLRLSAEVDAVVVAELEKTADTADEIEYVVFGKGVVERQHRHRMPDFSEAARRRRANFLRRRIAGDELRKSGFDRAEALAQRVIFGVRNLRRVILIVSLVMALEFERQPFVLDLGLRLGEGVDVGKGFCLCCFSHGPEYDEEGSEKSRRGF
jgi:hypothetical protein